MFEVLYLKGMCFVFVDFVVYSSYKMIVVEFVQQMQVIVVFNQKNKCQEVVGKIDYKFGGVFVDMVGEDQDNEQVVGIYKVEGYLVDFIVEVLRVCIQNYIVGCSYLEVLRYDFV